MPLAAIILAAGKGVRMQSELPKVFHQVLGKPLLQYVIEAVQQLSPQKICVVVGYKKESIIDYFKGFGLEFVVQEQQLGTGHAVMQARENLKDFSGEVLVLNGDMPLMKPETLQNLVKFHRAQGAAATVLTARIANPGAFGRIVRDNLGAVWKIVEKKDAAPAELKINEINTGTFCFDAQSLFAILEKITPENAQKEYYVTDTIALLKAEGKPVFAFVTEDGREALGVNTREELAVLEKMLSAQPWGAHKG
ncbi:MAG: sugar phosphate nucleotidyltransferase [Candidatus Margulisiibacteriota bacterium]